MTSLRLVRTWSYDQAQGSAQINLTIPIQQTRQSFTKAKPKQENKCQEHYITCSTLYVRVSAEGNLYVRSSTAKALRVLKALGSVL